MPPSVGGLSRLLLGGIDDFATAALGGILLGFAYFLWLRPQHRLDGQAPDLLSCGLIDPSELKRQHQPGSR
jgi:hypothetical protein